MTKAEVIDRLELYIKLMELTGENVFKIRSNQSAVIQLENSFTDITAENIKNIEAEFGKSTSSKIGLILTTSSFPELDALKAEVPDSVISMFAIKGLGPKKLKQLWQEHEIDSIEKLLDACQSNLIAGYKGFGIKTQDNFLAAINYLQANEGKLLYAYALPISETLLSVLEKVPFIKKVALCGQMATADDVIDQLDFLLSINNNNAISHLENLGFKINFSKSGPTYLYCSFSITALPVILYLTIDSEFDRQLFLLSAKIGHLQYLPDGKQSIAEIATQMPIFSDHHVYETAGINYIPSFGRQGFQEFDCNFGDGLVQLDDIKGLVHNHSKYSDGENTVAEMAESCAALGMYYFGIADHSKTATYAGGLKEEDVFRQHKEIDAYNASNPKCYVLKGIESDILQDGALDYAQDVLSTFDYVVASVHSNLNMGLKQATDRLLIAINNPYTSILGHASGRLLLKRAGYPLDYKEIIKACIANKVSIELNAHPMRLDFDWHWLKYAADQGAIISINPDAHRVSDLSLFKFGVIVAQKAGLQKNQILNCLPLEGIKTFFKKDLTVNNEI